MATTKDRAPRAREAMRHVETTLPDEKTAARIAQMVLEDRLAACANWWPITSRYWWEGELETETEVLVVFKTTLGRASELQRRLHEVHPYEVPYIGSYPLTYVSPPYGQWAAREVNAIQR